MICADDNWNVLLTHLFEPKIFLLASGRGREDTARLCAFFSGQKGNN